MKKHQTFKKSLSLDVETVRSLAADQLDAARGGIETGNCSQATCPTKRCPVSHEDCPR
jgi:hypothetical protein